eukprot:SAG31_NODE_643_length_13291_cov_6.294042_3_plen_89_part_00
MSDTFAATDARKLHRRYGSAARLRRRNVAATTSGTSAKAQRTRRNPVDAWPGSLMFFFRTTGLLRGLCSQVVCSCPAIPDCVRDSDFN